MQPHFSVSFHALDHAREPVVLAFVTEELILPPSLDPDGTFTASFAALARREAFTGKANTALDLVAPAGLACERLLVVGVGQQKAVEKLDWVQTGGHAMGRLPSKRGATILAELHGAQLGADVAADLALGCGMRAYAFNKYKTKDQGDQSVKVVVATGDAAAAKRAFRAQQAVLDGVNLARDLVNEPPNVLGPEEFAERAESLSKLGVEVEVLDQKALRKIGMNALLGVAQGSKREARVVIMRWSGAKNDDARPICFVGKGVCFDTGGISIKPAQNMEDMKGDMAGAACVVGLMQTLAARKAKVNAIGVIGLVENMPDGNAQRPGDIVTSLSGQTIEIINTDAEGRLVLADLLWYVQAELKPVFMIDLATLTGAILVALAQEHAGLFSNSDELSARLVSAGLATGEKVWRMPLAPEYDKMMDSKFADVKNAGGRNGGAITAAQFLQRFVNDAPWAHLDIAGTGMAAPQTETNRSWGSGWGVRLLNQLVRDHYED
jgi:leucyl aminopeptidase